MSAATGPGNDDRAKESAAPAPVLAPAPAPAGWRLWTLFLGLATFTQLAFKWGGSDLEKLDFGAEWFAALARSPAVACAILGYIVMFGVWLHILQRTSLSRAFMMTGLVYVTVPLAASVIFSEKIGVYHAAGIALIIAGIVLMGDPGGNQGSKPHG